MLKRHITSGLLEALSDTPVVTLHGARQTGKSTLVQALAEGEYPAPYFTLDDLSVLEAVRRDPAGFVAGLSGPVILDEVQRAPDLLLAIKSRVDRDRRPGRFLLTGSAQILSLPRLADVLAGRMEVLTLWPLSQGEIEGAKEGFIDALFAEEFSVRNGRFSGKAGKMEKEAVFDRMLKGGYPEVLSRPRLERRRAWFDSYLSLILQRDVRDLANIAGLADLPRMMAALASRAGSLMNQSELARDLGLNQMTFRRYFSLLEAIFMVRVVPPWFNNRLKRLMKTPKLYLGDTGLLAHLLDLTPERLRRDPNASGALLENFVVMEIMKQRTWSRTRPELFHFRDFSGAEVDLVLESPGGRMIAGVEVKAGATVGPGDFKGLKLLSAALGPRFRRGVVLYTGPTVIPFDKNLFALPVSALWRLTNKYDEG
ncbi:MAG TPA: ATP-binding protein [bacterium]|nr:ATP-binding protein [bacterium]